MEYILVVDEGTTSTRAILFDKNGKPIHTERQKLNLLFPKPGYAECCAEEIWEKTKQVMQDCVKNSGVSTADIVSIGMTAQRESALIWEKETGKPIFNLITWQDSRTDDYCNELNKDIQILLDLHDRTGLLISSFFPAPKIVWMLDNIPGARERAEKGELVFGTIDTWLMYNMTEGKRFVAEQSNASRTLLYNINTLDWDDKMLELFNIPKSMLAQEVLPSDAQFGVATGIFDRDIPICGSLGDQQAATLGQHCFKPGEGKISLGTSGAMSLNIGDSPSTSLKLLSTLGWNINGKVSYHYETGFYFCGGLLTWLQDLGFISSHEESSEIAYSVEDSAGVKLVNTFVGMSVPEFIDDARGMISGLTPFAKKEHIIRAALESIGFQTKDGASLINEELKNAGRDFKFECLSVDGGVSNNEFIMHFIANILGLEVFRNNSVEATALGAFYISALATRLIKDVEAIQNNPQDITIYRPDITIEERKKLYNEWLNTLNNAIDWGKNIHTEFIKEA